MMNLIELKKKRAAGKRLTKKEQEYLNRFDNLKRYRHSTSFIAHARKIPEENDGKVKRREMPIRQKGE